jgi:DNA-binding MarR family transcriptional regulator
MPDWTIISNHGLVLAYIAKHPQNTAREIATAIKITEWTVHKIIAELEKEGYIKRQKVGRNNVYDINPRSSLRHETLRHIKVEDLLKTLGWRHPKKQYNISEPNRSGSIV